MSEGKFHILVQIIFFEPDIKSVVLPRALVFETIDSDHPDAVRGPYKGQWPGIIRPRLIWSNPERVSKD